MKRFGLVFKIMICLLIAVFLCIQYFGYSSEPVDYQLHKDIQEKYCLKLPDENWRYIKYDKNTLLNAKPTFYNIYNPFLSFDGYSVSIDITEEDEIFETSLPAMLFRSKRNQVMIEKQMSYNNIDMTVQVLETDPDDFEIEYPASLRIIFNYNDCLYHFNFSQSTPMSYSIYSTEIHEDEINACLNIMDEVLLYK